MNNNISYIKNLLHNFLITKDITDVNYNVEKIHVENLGHLTTNLAFLLAKKLKTSPSNIAQEIISFLQTHDTKKYITKVAVAGNGFLNFTLSINCLMNTVNDILKLKSEYGKSPQKNFIYNLEIVSANPTGYLHIGHARNGAIGDSVARILAASGYTVQTEYYVNDAGNQINILAITVFCNYLLLLGKEVKFPEECYKGDMYKEVAQWFIDQYQDKFINITFNDDYKLSDPEVHQLFRVKSSDLFLAEIKRQLSLFRVSIEYYSSEQHVYEDGEIEKTIAQYKKVGKAYEKDGALWLKTTDFGDDKDRVLIKNNGDYTYITPDLAVHNERLIRTKANKLINFWGGDHHGYIIRMLAGLQLLGYNKDVLSIDVIQMVRLIKNGTEYKMSKRKGTAVWLLDLIEEIGVDPIRYMLVSKSGSSQMDLDIDLLTEHSSKNPVYYAQYALARCHSILKQAQLNEIMFDQKANLSLLNNNKELNLLNELDLYNSVLTASARLRAPHFICDYIQTIARQFHSYYNEFKVINLENIALTQARLLLIESIRIVLTNLFALIGVTALEKM